MRNLGRPSRSDFVQHILPHHLTSGEVRYWHFLEQLSLPVFFQYQENPKYVHHPILQVIAFQNYIIEKSPNQYYKT